MTYQQPNPYAPAAPQPQQGPNQFNPTSRAIPNNGTPAAAANPTSGPGMPNFGDISRNNEIYNIANPQLALRSALRDMGYNPMMGNPVMKTIMAMAPGLAGSFLMRGANGLEGAGSEESTNAAGGMGKFFGDFLRNSLGNNGAGAIGMLRDPLGGQSEAGNTASGAAMTAQRRVEEYRKMAGAGEGGATPSSLNPFAAYLANMQDDDPTAGANMLSSMYTPFMGAFARPYAEGIQNLNEVGRQRYERSIDRPEVNPFSWLLNPGIR